MHTLINKQLLDEIFVIFRITEFNNCFIIHCIFFNSFDNDLSHKTMFGSPTKQ